MWVRWDAIVQDNSFWSEHPRQSQKARIVDPNNLNRVQVRLFGSLNNGVTARPLTLDFVGPFTIKDVIVELGRLYGTEFLDCMVDVGGVLSRTCRVIVNGQLVEDTTTPIVTNGFQAEVEMILLSAIEGG